MGDSKCCSQPKCCLAGCKTIAKVTAVRNHEFDWPTGKHAMSRKVKVQLSYSLLI